MLQNSLLLRKWKKQIKTCQRLKNSERLKIRFSHLFFTFRSIDRSIWRQSENWILILHNYINLTFRKRRRSLPKEFSRGRAWVESGNKWSLFNQLLDHFRGIVGIKKRKQIRIKTWIIEKNFHLIWERSPLSIDVGFIHKVRDKLLNFHKFYQNFLKLNKI